MGVRSAVRHGIVALVALALMSLPSLARARTLSLSGLDGIDLTKGLRLLPQSQLDQATGFLPKGQLADDPVVWPIALGQFALSAAINIGGVALFDYLTTAPAGWSTKAVQGQLITYSIVQFLTQPLVSATSVYLVGEADDLHDVGYGWPLLANYAAELVLVGVKLGLDLGAVKGTEVATKAADMLSTVAAADYVLHALLPPIATTYFSLRSRDPKAISFGQLDRVLPSTKSVADARAEAALAVAQPLIAAVPVAVGRF